MDSADLEFISYDQVIRWHSQWKKVKGDPQLLEEEQDFVEHVEACVRTFREKHRVEGGFLDDNIKTTKSQLRSLRELTVRLEKELQEHYKEQAEMVRRELELASLFGDIGGNNG